MVCRAVGPFFVSNNIDFGVDLLYGSFPPRRKSVKCENPGTILSIFWRREAKTQKTGKLHRICRNRVRVCWRCFYELEFNWFQLGRAIGDDPVAIKRR